ncbi:unnamed protein product [Peronospora destructor]|uniref:Uncharacterized protein n=1 Tax=Peronospora destructor TaxID=86335 RepID=A0AAV0V6Z4_9STRA|nr:unnamed protein product [Peronospora destructor]
MVATGVFVATAHNVVVTVRNIIVFVLPTITSDTQKLLRFEVLQGADGVVEAPEVDDDADQAEKLQKKQATKPAAPANRITAVELFQPQGLKLFALLLLVDERRLVYYELNLSAETLLLKASRSVPRSATCMTVGHLKLDNGETKYAVIVGQKTGEAVAVPFPDVARDLKTLLGHTTSMVTDVAVNHDSSLLLTADRDEKLRVSRFPNATIIESYCLGHAASLTKLACSSVTPELVVTTSMDNTLKLWNMMTGKLGRKAAKSLLNVSLAICLKTNIVAVLVNYQFVRFYEIVFDNGVPTLKERTKCLRSSYKKNPFLQLFFISKGQNRNLSPVDSMTDVFNDFRNAAATIELVDDEKNALDVLEDGLKKKKARTVEWNKKVSGHK